VISWIRENDKEFVITITMRKVTLLVLMLAFAKVGFGFHIVGGEIELIHINGFVYNLNLIQYFDRAQTDNQFPDNAVTVFIYRNSDNSFVETYTMPFISETPVEYSNIECALDNLVTARIFYSLEVTLDPAQYDQEEGYHVVWERCCRNEGIVNIINPRATGSTYVLEFPAIVRDGEQFINSSPTLLPPLSDFACVDQLYYADFQGVDLDGDSLVYSLETPLNSSSTVPVPSPPQPRINHFGVTYAPGVTVNNIVPGSPSLAITNDGFLTVEPDNPGLYVFSVIVREFRDGVQIGRVTRDFQMLAVDGCNPPDPPVAVVQLPGNPTLFEEEATVNFTVAEEKCFDFIIGNLGPEEEASVRILPINFEGGVNFNMLDNGFTFDQNRITADSSIFTICVPECPLLLDEPYIIDIIALDDACPLPQQDTVRLTVNVEPPPNRVPFFRDINTDRISLSVNENEVFTRTFNGDDLDLDVVDMVITGMNDIVPSDIGIGFTTNNDVDGTVSGEFIWDANCAIFDFTSENNFELALLLDDNDICNVPGDTLFLDLDVILPFNSNPEVTSDLSTTSIAVDKEGSVDFTAFATDLDGDRLNLSLIGDGFNPADIGVNFEDVTGSGRLSSDFNWDLVCGNLNLENGNEFRFFLVADDFDRCRRTNFDTLTVDVVVDTGFNNKPLFTEELRVRSGVNEIPVFNASGSQSLQVNETHIFEIEATDLDLGDNINIDLLPGFNPPGLGFNFVPGSGQGSAVARIEWTPPCSLLGTDFAPRNFNVFLLARDDNCPTQKFDTLQVNLSLENLPVDFELFDPPNVFTPNGDGTNDFFMLSGFQGDNEKFNLPLDNCIEQFQLMTIVDRSGREIFMTENREFIWDGAGVPAGTYFYYIKYTTRDFQGAVTVAY